MVTACSVGTRGRSRNFKRGCPAAIFFKMGRVQPLTWGNFYQSSPKGTAWTPPSSPLDLPLGAVYPMRLVEVLVLSSEWVCVLFACLRTVLGRITACTLLLAPLLPHVNTVANYIIMSIEPIMCSLILAATPQPLTFQRAVASSWAH